MLSVRCDRLLKLAINRKYFSNTARSAGQQGTSDLETACSAGVLRIRLYSITEETAVLMKYD